MNRRMYTIYGIGIMLAMQESIIGKRMVVRDNSYIVSKADREAQGFLYGKIVEIISEPFDEFVDSIACEGRTHTNTFVYVRSLESGVEYRVLWRESWLVDANDIIPKDDVRGRNIILSDGSYSVEIGGIKKLWGIDKNHMIIVSNPYVRECGDIFRKTYKYLFVDALNLKDGKVYSVLFNEADLQPENDVKITLEVKIELS